MSAAVDFLRLLFPDGLEGLKLALWRASDKRSFYVDKVEEVARFEGAENVYFSPALITCEAAERLGPHRRPRARDGAAIPGVWVDIDVNGGPKAKRGYAPDLAAAAELARSLTEPTLLVNSGFGLHAWWLFEEPWVFGSEQEREQAARILQGFQAALRRVAEQRGFRLDATHDLARLMRPPGTLNSP